MKPVRFLNSSESEEEQIDSDFVGCALVSLSEDQVVAVGKTRVSDHVSFLCSFIPKGWIEKDENEGRRRWRLEAPWPVPRFFEKSLRNGISKERERDLRAGITEAIQDGDRSSAAESSMMLDDRERAYYHMKILRKGLAEKGNDQYDLWIEMLLLTEDNPDLFNRR